MSSPFRLGRLTKCAATVAAAVLLTIFGLHSPGSVRAASAERASVTQGAGSVFPARSLVLAVAGDTSLAPSDVSVLENGHAVAGTIVTPIANARARDFGVVLALDISPSMSGAPLGNAMRAARELATRRSGEQQLGVVEFDQQPHVVLPLTTDEAAITHTLAHVPAVGGGTHIYDALELALEQLRLAHVTAGSVILVSDGADRGSLTSESAVAAAARAQHVALYSVGVKDRFFESGSLEQLARDGGGQYVEARPGKLRAVLAGISSQLASRYVIHYRSLQPLGRSVSVAVRVAGVPGTATLSYATPQPPANEASSRAKAFWASTLALLLVVGAAALLIGIAAAVYMLPRRRRDGVTERIAPFTTPAPASPPRAASTDEARKETAFDSMFAGNLRWSRFREDVEIARFEHSAGHLFGMCVLVTTTLATVLGIVAGPVLALAVLALGPWALRERVRHRLRQQRDLFSEQLPGHLQELASTMRAGHSFASGLRTIATSGSEPSKAEWARVVTDEQLGVPLEAALVPLQERMASTELRQVSLVASLQQQTGGNMAEVIERVADGIRERADLRRELEALTAQAKLSRRVVTALPIGVGLIVYAINPRYMSPLFETNGGQLALAIAVGMVILGSLVMRKITDVRT